MICSQREFLAEVQPSEPPKDLIVLVADKNMKAAVGGLLSLNEQIGTRRINIEGIYPHQKRDPGVYKFSPEFLRPFLRLTTYALALFDREGCGSELPRTELEEDLERRLVANGWQNRCAVVVIDPELENWVWGSSSQVATCLGWQENPLRDWLAEQGRWPAGTRKPPKPKEAIEAALRFKRIARSSSIYSDVAKAARFDRCTDAAFLKLRSTLQRWFPLATA